MVDDSRIMVSIGVVTYNQDKYISQCLESILKQVVDFEYEIIVGDDASSDSTQSILLDYQSRYPRTIKLIINDSNRGISNNYKSVLSKCSGKYIALCEGDDFWIDPNKLAKQVHFLETHCEFGFVGAYSQLLFPDGHFEEDQYRCPKEVPIEGEWELFGNVFDSAKFGPVTRTASICFRKAIILPYIDIEGLGNDLVLQTVLSKFSLFAKNKKVMTIFRQTGVSTNKENWDKQIYYNNWYIKNRLLQKELFPYDCNWDENSLLDRGDYIRLRKAIKFNDWRMALDTKKSLRTKEYLNKTYAKYLHGPISCFVLSLTMLRLYN